MGLRFPGQIMGEAGARRIDFDEWRELAASDPDAFEARRAAVLEQVILRVPGPRRKRLRGLQWRIDQVRQRSTNPISACIKLNGMMMDTLLGEGGLLSRLEGFRRCEPPRRHLACVLPFSPSRRRGD